MHNSPFSLCNFRQKGLAKNRNFICIPGIDVGCPLAGLTDVFWNSERLSQIMNPVDAETVVKAIADYAKYS